MNNIQTALWHYMLVLIRDHRISHSITHVAGARGHSHWGLSEIQQMVDQFWGEEEQGERQDDEKDVITSTKKPIWRTAWHKVQEVDIQRDS